MAVRQTKPVDVDALDRIHQRLREVRVTLVADPSSRGLRALFAEIRQRRNQVARIMSGLIPLHGRLRADRERVGRVVEAATARTIDRREGFLGCRTEKERAARVKILLEAELDEQAGLEADVALVAETLAHARLVLDELRAAFEEASRGLASLDLEYRIETGGQ